MLKKILITLFIVPVIAAAIYGYFHFKQIKTPLSSVIQAIPSNSAAILKCNHPQQSLKNFTMQNPVWKSLVSYPFFGEMHSQLGFLDGLFLANKDASNAILDKPLFISIHPDAENRFGYLFFINLPNTISKKQVNDFVTNAAGKSAGYSMRIYDGVALNELVINEGKTLYYFFTKGIFACTFSRFLIEDAIMQLNSGIAISADPSFDKVWNAAGKKVEATLFLNYNYSAQILNNIIQNKAAKFTKSFSSFANWTCLDIKAKSNAYQLTGFTFSIDSSNNYLGIFNGQSPQECNIAGHIPASTAYFNCYTLSDLNLYFKNYDNYLGHSTAHFSRLESLNKLNKNFGVNAQNFFKQWMGNQFAYVITEPETMDYTQNCYALIETNGNADVDKILADFKYKVESKIGRRDSVSEIFRGYKLDRIAQVDLIPLVFGDIFQKLKEAHFVRMNNQVIFANSSAALKNWINQQLAGRSLQANENYKSFAENIATQSTIFVYAAPARSTFLYQDNFQADFLNWNQAKAETIQKFHAIAIQLNAAPSLFYSNVYMEYNDCYRKIDNSILDAETDTIINSKPTFLKHPKDSSVKIFVQDAANKIYLFDDRGKLVWKQEMDEKIISEVQALQDPKSKQLAILFSTKTKIYLLDDLGDDIGKFPVQLPFIASNGVKVVDYDHSGEYRFLIATENKRLYNFSYKGDPTNGWEAVTNASEINTDVQFFRAKGLDYIVVVDKSGTINLLDRKGKSVVKFKSKFKNILGNEFFLDIQNTLNASSIIGCDSAGLVTKLYFSGKSEKLQFNKAQKDFHFLYFKKSGQYGFLTKNTLQLYDQQRNLKSESKLNFSGLLSPAYYEDENKNPQIAIAESGKGIRMISGDGMIRISHEVAPTTPAVLSQFFGDKSWYVGLASGKKLIVYPTY